MAGNPIDGLTFTPKAAKLSPGLSREKAEIDGMPIVTVSLPEPSGYPDGDRGDPASGYPDAPEDAQAYEDAVLGLEALGWKKKEAPLRARRALDELGKRGEKVTAETLLREALRAPAGQRREGPK